MPIYEYKRPDGTTFEIMQSFSDDPLEKDPESGVPVQRVFHAPAVHFKGKGFYNTDYGTKNRQRELKDSAEKGADKHDAKTADKKADKASGDSSSSSSSSSSSDSKPAASSSTGSSTPKPSSSD